VEARARADREDKADKDRDAASQAASKGVARAKLEKIRTLPLPVQVHNAQPVHRENRKSRKLKKVEWNQEEVNLQDSPERAEAREVAEWDQDHQDKKVATFSW